MNTLKNFIAALAVFPTLLSCGCVTLPVTTDVDAEVILDDDGWLYCGDGRRELRVALAGRDTSDCRTAVNLLLLTDMKDTAAAMTRYGIFKGKDSDTVCFPVSVPPGFYRAEISLSGSEGTAVPVKVFNIGCDPEKIVSPQDRSGDFQEFWDRTLAELAAVDPQYVLTFLPDRSNDLRSVYRVDMKSFGGVSVSGIYAEPAAPGRYPAYITYMGYDSAPWYPDPSSNPEAVEFILSVRGQALNKRPGDKAGWVAQGIGSKETYYYRGAFMDVVRAVDFICSREKADSSRIFAEGGSQGGALTMIAAALDNRIKAIAPFVPFLSDFPDYFKIAPWPAQEVEAAADSLGISDEELYRTLSYFDVKNFADRIGCPVLMGFGLQDDVCPPHTNFAGYNLIKAEKRYVCFPEAGHHVETEAGWWKARNEFFDKILEQHFNIDNK